MEIIAPFVRRPVMTTVLVLIALILGIVSYTELGLRRFPDIEFPFATIRTVYPGGSPQEIETDITDRIEDAISSISGIEEITSYSQQGLSLVLVQFKLEEDIDVRATDISNKIDQIQADLPEGADDPVVDKFDITQLPVLRLALRGPQNINDLFRLADEELETMLAQVTGVARVEVTGGQEREIHVLLDAGRLRKHRLPVAAVAAALQGANLDVPGGEITQPDREYIIRAVGKFQTVEEIEKVRVPTRGDGIVTIGDLGRVEDTFEQERTRSRYAGAPAVVMTVQAQTDANEVQVADAVKARLPELEAMLPQGATLDIASDDTEFVRGALSNVRNNMVIGILLTAAALYLFLKSGRSTLIATVVIPAAVIATFTFMRFSGFTLNILSLTGLAIVIGVLVNNAILILENVTGLVNEGMEPREAAIRGTNDIALAILSSTATNLVVFLPLAFMGEIIGRFFKELGLTVVYATTVSLLVSFTLTPMMCGLLLRREEKPATLVGSFFHALVGWTATLWRAGFERVKGVYLGLLDWCLHWRKTTLLVAGLAAVASLGVFAAVGMEFQPPMDEGQFTITVQAPVGSSLDWTDRVVRRMEEHVQQLPHLVDYTVRVGTVSGFLGGSSEGVNLAEMTVRVVDRAEREMSLDDLMEWLAPRLATVPGGQIVMSREGGPGGAPIEVQISGDDLQVIQSLAERIVDITERTPGTSGVSKSYQTGQPEVRIVPDRTAINRHNLETGTVTGALRTYVEGRTATEFTDRNENYDVVVMLKEADRQWAEDISRMFVASSETGGMLRLGQVAEIREQPGPTLITRLDRRRLITVSSQLTGERPSGVVKTKIEQAIDQELRPLPEGVQITFGGEAEMIRKNFSELAQAMVIAAVLTFLCVAGIIESFGFALVIIMSLPVCLIGVALAMLIGDVTVNMFSLMAMVILIGMVVNNAIIVVDLATREERQGMTARQAMRDACEKRFRMIVMANMTTVAALVPLSLGLGFGGEIFRPLAIVEMGGVVAAGALSLLAIPAVYVLIYERRHSRQED